MKSTINTVLNTPFNWSLIVLTAFITFMLISPYNAQGQFDMAASLFNYIILVSGGALILHGRCRDDKHGGHQGVVSLSAGTLLLSMVTLFCCKSILIPFIVSLVLTVLTIFMFLLLVKNVTLESAGK